MNLTKVIAIRRLPEDRQKLPVMEFPLNWVICLQSSGQLGIKIDKVTQAGLSATGDPTDPN